MLLLHAESTAPRQSQRRCVSDSALRDVKRFQVRRKKVSESVKKLTVPGAQGLGPSSYLFAGVPSLRSLSPTQPPLLPSPPFPSSPQARRRCVRA